MVQVVMRKSRTKFERSSGGNQNQMASEVRHSKTRSFRDSTCDKRKTKSGIFAPYQGCDVELTEVKIVSQSGTWWTLGFEAFGDIDTVPAYLTMVLLPDKPFLAPTIGSGALMSYPAWLVNDICRVN